VVCQTGCHVESVNPNVRLHSSAQESTAKIHSYEVSGWWIQLGYSTRRGKCRKLVFNDGKTLFAKLFLAAHHVSVRSADMIVWDCDVLNVVDNRCGA